MTITLKVLKSPTTIALSENFEFKSHGVIFYKSIHKKVMIFKKISYVFPSNILKNMLMFLLLQCVSKRLKQISNLLRHEFSH